jgi:NADH-quinone oxidoreductase subunit G
MGVVVVNSCEIQIGDQERLNGIQVAQRAGVEIPHYCWHPGLSVVASCRMCLVETGTRNPQTGEIAMMPKLVPACQTPAKDGTVFVTESGKVKRARALVEEDLLIDHPIDCPICDKAGECRLQDYHFEHGQKERRADIHPFTSRRRPVGDTVTLFVDRCIMCTRCVRFTREISGTSELMVINRGAHEEIDVFPGDPLANKLAGNVVDLCPVGALGDVDFLYRQRVWFMKSRPHVCPHCSTGCSIRVDENQDHVYRIKPRENPEINEWWVCDEGRYGYHHVHSADRLTAPSRREGDAWVTREWPELLSEIHEKLTSAGHIAALFSPYMTVEEAYLLAKYVRGLDAHSELVLGPIPTEGADEKYPKGFVIHAEKCPNRRGVEEVLRHFAGDVVTFADFTPTLTSGNIDALWVAGGYIKAWAAAELVEGAKGVGTLIVQDLFSSPLAEAATYRLPSAAFAEKSGSYVNFADHLQSFDWAIRAPAGVWTEGQVFWRLLNKTGLYRPRHVLEEFAAANEYFAPALGEVPATGIKLAVETAAGEPTRVMTHAST